MKTSIVIVLIVVVVGSVGVWAKGQGVFDPPRVRMVRMLTDSNPQALAVARIIEQGVSVETQSLIFEAAQTELDVEYDNRSVTLAWYLIDEMAYGDPRHAYFDWKEDSDSVAPAFDEMLDFYGISERPDMALLRQNEQDYSQEFTAMPIILAHYAPIFERNGLALMTLDADWDAYYFFVTKRKTGFLWRNVRIMEPEANAHLNVARILPLGANIAEVTDPTKIFDEVLNVDQQVKVPWRSGN